MADSVFECQSISDVMNLASHRKGRKLSQSQMAKLLGYSSPRVVGMILSGKRSASSDCLMRLSKLLKLTDREHRFVSLLNQKMKSGQQRLRADLDKELEELRIEPPSIRRLTDSEMAVWESWYFSVIKQILAALRELSIPSLSALIEDQISADEIERAVGVLQQMGFARREGDRLIWVPEQEDSLRSSFDIPSASIRKFHRNVLQKASESLDEQSVLDREFVSATVRLDSRKLPHFKARLREFIDEVLQDCGQEDADTIYQLGTYFFRVGRLR